MCLNRPLMGSPPGTTGDATSDFPKAIWAWAWTASLIRSAAAPASGSEWSQTRRWSRNRLHLDIHVSGSRSDPLATRRQRVDAKAKRLTDLGASSTGALSAEGLDHYAIGMKDPEGNEFDIN
jgi:hypothetical protein